ncbi:hypothetical protein [Rufibacter psychrotolerans]|nr:hypothetical protein [Rufibacter sp. SYSU D00308]
MKEGALPVVISGSNGLLKAAGSIAWAKFSVFAEETQRVLGLVSEKQA